MKEYIVYNAKGKFIGVIEAQDESFAKLKADITYTLAEKPLRISEKK